MYDTKKWLCLYLGILSLVPIALYLIEKDYGFSLIRAVLFTAAFFGASIYYFIKDAPYKNKKQKRSFKSNKNLDKKWSAVSLLEYEDITWHKKSINLLQVYTLFFCWNIFIQCTCRQYARTRYMCVMCIGYIRKLQRNSTKILWRPADSQLTCEAFKQCI